MAAPHQIIDPSNPTFCLLPRK